MSHVERSYRGAGELTRGHGMLDRPDPRPPFPHGTFSAAPRVNRRTDPIAQESWISRRAGQEDISCAKDLSWSLKGQPGGAAERGEAVMRRKAEAGEAAGSRRTQLRCPHTAPWCAGPSGSARPGPAGRPAPGLNHARGRPRRNDLTYRDPAAGQTASFRVAGASIHRRSVCQSRR